MSTIHSRGGWGACLLYTAGVAGVLVYYTQQGWLGCLSTIHSRGGWGACLLYTAGVAGVLVFTIETKPAQSGQTSAPVDHLR